MDRKNIETFYPLSPMQQGMLFHTLYEPESGIYVELLTATWRGDVDVDAFRRTWQKVVNRHTALRTAFLWEGLKEPIQVVQRHAEVTVHEHDWRGLTPEVRKERMQNYLREERESGFDLRKAPLLRLALIRTSDDTYELIWTHHHLLMDGWSIPLLLKEVFAFYGAYLQGEELQLPRPRPYRDYIVWLKQQDMAAAERYWREKLLGFTEPTPLVVDKHTGAGDQDGGRFADVEVDVSAERTAALQQLAQRHGLTVNTLLQGAWALLLSRYSGNDDVVYGATVSGRPAELPGVNDTIGLFINTLPVRVHIPEDATVILWLQELQAQQVEMRQYEYTPLADIQSWNDMTPGAPLFESLLVFENIPLEDAVEQGRGLDLKDVETASSTNFPLVFVIVPDREMSLQLLYDTNHFDAATIERMMGHLQAILQGFVVQPDGALASISILTEPERIQVVETWNATNRPFDATALVHEQVQIQAERAPRALALAGPNGSLTYGELNHRANQLAHYLAKLGIGPGALVAVFMERSPETVMAILAVLKTGAAYLPLDPDYPQNRLSFVLEDARTSVVLTQAGWDNLLPGTSTQVVLLDKEWPSIALEPASNLGVQISPEHLAYVIYTSGSTGQPKGVQIQHRGLSNLIAWHQREFGVSSADRTTHLAGLGFDAVVWEIWPYLSAGASIHIPDEDARISPDLLRDFVVDQRIDISFWPTLLAEHAVEFDWPAETRLRYMLTGGDMLHRYPREGLPFTLINGYGPTESTVLITWHPVPVDPDAATAPAIGRPIDNGTAYLLDKHLQPVPVGVPGELYIGGVALATGYLRRPGLTAEKFIPDPFSRTAGARLYRSGDLARYRPDGNIEFLGRIDHQVKLRGFRIELGEIEAVLVRHPQIRKAIVLAREDKPGDKRLVAYLIPHDRSEPVRAMLRSYLHEQLPSYMMPSDYVFMDAFPLTAHGKVDRRLLPAPEHTRAALGIAYTPPRSQQEKTLSEIWAKMLGLQQVGINDNFFELGGDSIMSIQVVGRARQLGLFLSPRQLFEHPTIAALVDMINQEAPEEPEQSAVTGSVALTPIQSWFFDNHAANPHQWNTSMFLEIHGGLEPTVLEKTVRALQTQHDALRLRFEQDGAEWRQYVSDEVQATPLSIVDLSSVEPDRQRQAIEAKAAELQRSLNVFAGPLFRVAYFDLGRDQPARLLMIFHHLVMDGVSWRTLLEDFQAFYRQLVRERTPQMPPKTTSFLSWAQHLRRYAQSSEVRQEMPFWLQMAEIEPTVLPMDDPDGRNTFGVTEHVTVSLDPDRSRMLLTQLPAQLGVRANDTLITALTSVLGRFSGGKELLLEMEGHGREDIIPGVDLSRTIGWFTSSFPMVFRLEDEDDPYRLVSSIQKQLRQLPHSGIGYGLLCYLHEDDDVRRQMQSIPRPLISFNYLGDFGRGREANEPAAVPPQLSVRWHKFLVQARKTLSQIVPQRIQMAEESVGPEQNPDGERTALIYIVSIVSEGELHIRWLYSREQYRRETIEQWAGEYIQELTSLIERLAQAPTPS